MQSGIVNPILEAIATFRLLTQELSTSETDVDEQEEAAVMVQALWRGRAVRIEVL